MVIVWSGLGMPSALAGLEDDGFDGNIFALYSGNGSLVPPRVTLTDSFNRAKPALLVFYIDDSRDCKTFATTVSQLQQFYGRAADFIPISADAIAPETVDDPKEPGHYYRGLVPQTVLINQAGEVVLDEVGQVSFETIDDQFRQVFDLLPRAESKELKRKAINEINTELVREE
ncbi:MAG: thioredoxin family protein [Oscillatoriales cyanobacterium RM1_1_9]|nr:thioredoxin family protein [Oscillatoriales cyanobacterium SM2_3_0]NJO45016.1 thioredoxin family protein [Oscillatoriales cyanobacterium RM2_1_1]NJO72182.1 thioredoxin family protein [Oscillatoriales cyanobacterium RM1_1_9]